MLSNTLPQADASPNALSASFGSVPWPHISQVEFLAVVKANTRKSSNDDGNIDCRSVVEF